MKKAWLEILNDFAKTHTLAESLDVEISNGHTSIVAKDAFKGARYEDCILLADILRGAENFLYFLQRNDYTLRKKRRKDDEVGTENRKSG